MANQETLLSERSSCAHMEAYFQSCAKGGKVPLDDFVSALRSQVNFSNEIIFDALDKVRTHRSLAPEGAGGEPRVSLDPSTITLTEVTEVLQMLENMDVVTSPRNTTAALLRPMSGSNEQRPTTVFAKVQHLWAKSKRWATGILGRHNKKANDHEVYSSRMKPTTRLVLVVLVLSLVMSLAVAGTGIGLSWTTAMRTMEDELEKNVRMILSSVESFAYTQARQQARDSQWATGQMIADVVEGVGYDVNLQTTRTRQQQAVEMAAKFADSLFVSVSTERILSRAQLVAQTMSSLCEMGVSYNAADLVNRVNVKMTRGYEMLLLSSTVGGGVSVLTNLKRSTTCATPTCEMSPDIKYAIDRTMVLKEQSSFAGVDYTNSAVFIGYTPVDCLNLGLIFLVTKRTSQSTFLNQTVVAADECNKDASATPNSTELLVFNKSTPGKPMTALYDTQLCPYGVCGNDVAALVAMQNDSTIGLNYRGEEVLAVSAEMPNLNASAVLEVSMNDIKEDIFTQLGAVGTTINKKLNGTTELLLGKRIVYPNGSAWFSFLTTPKFRYQCAPNCGPATPMVRAAVNCISDAGYMIDYRFHEVVAAHVCFPKLSVGLVYKTDNDELIERSIKQAAAYANDQNKNEKGSMELQVGVQAPPANFTKPTVRFMSNYKFDRPNVDCSTTPCYDSTPSAEPMLKALANNTQVYWGTDYRGKRIMAAVMPSIFLKTGFVLKMDLSEIESPLIQNLLILLLTALGITILGILVIGFLARHMLATIEITWEKGKRAVEEQKEGFERLVSALYPKFASERLLAGDLQIVMEVPKATIFFSDICNFTALSNQLNPSELLEWIGYTFRVMDSCAEYHHIYKIKTIGDAYLAITGLPDSLEAPEDPDHTYRMVQFASNVVQIFSGRYVHPDAGECLKAMAARSVLIRNAPVGGGDYRKSMGGTSRGGKTGSKSLYSSDKASSVPSESKMTSSCPMRFGLALGPVIAGVLHGKCPAFDIWGKTVNLAARMEHTGRAGNVQCTEGVFNAVVNDSRCLISWQKPHVVYAKGFGNISAYFMRTTDQPPPKELMLSLSLEPRIETYVFEGSSASPQSLARMTMTTSDSGLAAAGGTAVVSRENSRMPGEVNAEMLEDV